MIGGKRAPGYTLIELLIVTTIFSIAMAILSQIFLSFTTLHRKVANSAVLGQDMRFITEMIVRSVRNNEVFYEKGISEKDTMIKLVTSDGVRIWISVGTPGAVYPEPVCTDTTVARCLTVSLDQGLTWHQLTSNRVEVTKFDVYVQPTEDPFIRLGGSYPSDIQPFVSVHLALKYRAEREKESVTLRTQTSVSSRIYKR